MAVSYTPLRYPGGKGKFADYIGNVIDMNGLSGAHYVEPFAGGAGVALSLLFSEHVKNIHINDLDRSVYAFWHSVLFETDALCEKISRSPITINKWLRCREIKNDAENYGLLELGFATFFLNRTNRSGILNGGVIGGIDQTGGWKIDARFNKKDLIARIQKIALFSSRISLSNLDACTYVKKKLPILKQDALVYFDPPYFVQGKRLYKNHFNFEDHERLAKCIAAITNHKWLVSYDNVPEIKKLYKKFRQQEFNLNYSAGNYSIGKEVMIFQPKLKVPDEIFVSKKRA